jgi:hypothetical protein
MSAALLLYPTGYVVGFTASATGPVTITTINGAPATNTIFFPLKIAESYFAELVITASTGTVDAVLRHSTDNAATFRALPLKFTQLASGPGTAGLVFKPAVGLSDAASVTTGATTGTAIASNVPFNVRAVQLYVTLGTPGATSGTLTFTMAQKGTSVQ